MMLGPGSIEWGSKRSPLEKFDYAAGDLALCDRHRGEWVGLMNVPHPIPSSRTQATANQFRQPRLQLAWVEPKLNCVILILGSRWEYVVTLSAIRNVRLWRRWQTFWPQVAPNLCSCVN
jgi:hypothetical protein